jgi:hypothetical protein
MMLLVRNQIETPFKNKGKNFKTEIEVCFDVWASTVEQQLHASYSEVI